MTDQEKLQKLFDAALRAPSQAKSGPPQRAFPTSPTQKVSAPETAPAPKPAPAVSNEAILPDPAAAAPALEPVEQTPEVPALDREKADELGALLDEKIRKTARKRRRSVLITAIVLLGSTGGSVAWFVQSPARIEALTSAIQEIRSVGDVKSIVAEFQKALDKIAARSQQIDQATAAMGIDPSTVTDEDPNMDAEMREMMGGGEGKTVGERNRALQAAFGDRAKEAGGAIKPAAAISEEDSFDFSN